MQCHCIIVQSEVQRNLRDISAIVCTLNDNHIIYFPIDYLMGVSCKYSINALYFIGILYDFATDDTIFLERT